jgi:pantoate--beta-alanine ligase
LDEPQRVEAAELYGVLRKVAGALQSGRTDWQQLEQAAFASLAERGWQPDYVASRGRDDLGPPSAMRSVVVLGAAKLGGTRLIDNLEP